jgi:hypothetical protein
MRALVKHLRQHTVGYVALFVALSGGAYAATALPANSVGTAQVKNHSLLGADFKAGQIPAGKRGAAGPAGAAGTFDASDVSMVSGPATTLCAYGGGDCIVGSSTAQCAGSSVPVSGGWIPVQGSALPFASVVYNGPDGAHGWGVLMANMTDAGGAFQAVAVCGSGGTSTLARPTSAQLGTIKQSVLTRLHTR